MIIKIHLSRKKYFLCCKGENCDMVDGLNIHLDLNQFYNKIQRSLLVSILNPCSKW
jgi:hypothetical protein